MRIKTEDKIVQQVLKKMDERSLIGQKKYGATMMQEIEGQEKDLLIIPGMVPNLIYPPSGCRFHPRCPDRFHPCDSVKPKTLEVAPNYFVACHLYDPQYNHLQETQN